MKLSPAQIELVVAGIRNTQGSLEDQLARMKYTDVEVESLNDIETRVFVCEQCGRWRDLGDLDVDDSTQMPMCRSCCSARRFED